MGQIKARLVRIEGPNENNITYADADQVMDGQVLKGRGGWSGIGWCLGDPADPTGKYEALWNLAQALNRAGVEVE